MSLDSAKAFVEKMKSDETFRNRVMAVEDVAGRLSLISSEGFDCSEEEIKRVSEELSDDELDRVAGGADLLFLDWCLKHS
ncbi:MAG: Nif11-like leader peptide family natural product precursor [Chlorobium sp.]